MWLTLERKQIVLIFPHFTGLNKKKIVGYTNPNFNQDLRLFKHVKKNKFSEYFSALFRDITFFV